MPAPLQVVQLHMGQLAKADELYNEAIGSAFNTSDEMFAADALLNAFDSGDPEALQQASKNQSIQFEISSSTSRRSKTPTSPTGRIRTRRSRKRSIT